MVSIFLAVNLLLNSRLGRNAEEVVADWIVQGWHRFGLRVITGLFWLVVDVFKGLLATIERMMYSVDEWLRFRSGESGASLAAKAGLGLLWFFLAYVLRFCVNVLIEPQINPIKHFPVVTVSHKLLLPLIPQFAGVLELTLEKALAWTVAGTIITGIPGVFGFSGVGAEGELAAVRGKPAAEPLAGTDRRTRRDNGPIAQARVSFRHAAKALRETPPCRTPRAAGASWRSVHKHFQAIQRIEASIRRYVEREFLELFAQSKSWQAADRNPRKRAIGHQLRQVGDWLPRHRRR